MAEAPYEYMFEIAGFEDVTAGCVKWPLSVIRLQGSSIGRLAKAIIEGKNIHDIEEIKIHADWVDEWLDSYDITTENIESIIQKEIADCFVQVLECAGVYKRTEKGFAAFKRFLSVL